MLFKSAGWETLTKMVCADLKCLGLPHDQPDLERLLVPEKLHCARSPLLPLVPLLIEPVKLRFSAETIRSDRRHQIRAWNTPTESGADEDEKLQKKKKKPRNGLDRTDCKKEESN